MYRKINNNAEFTSLSRRLAVAWKKPLRTKQLERTVTPSPNLDISNPTVSYKATRTPVKPTVWTRGKQVVDSGKQVVKPVTDFFTYVEHNKGKNRRKFNLKRTAGLLGLGVAGAGYYKANKYLNSEKPKQVNPIVEWWNS